MQNYQDDPEDEITNIKHICGVCNKTIARNHKAISCCICNLKIHIKCNRTDIKTYEKNNKANEGCICIMCKEETFPFFNLTDENFLITAKSTLMDKDNFSQISLLPSESLKLFFKGINDFLDPNSEDDDNIPLNCKYVDINTFKHKKNNSQFSLFHLNIVSLAKNKKELETILSLLEYKFDIIGLTETKIIKGIAPIFDTKFAGYKLFSTPT